MPNIEAVISGHNRKLLNPKPVSENPNQPKKKPVTVELGK